ncbi:uncharacterized protein PHACADRAFT_196226 [Phanerochaete carnosa HHB-10118-sp]|uniref:O-methyltransferase C-terminal domain-containing protein n=1 Tax=Phanerochaete carnosa (strain HHB-10118-sp) TaxID=650164 RepID=K5X078_PHACS|nr:uncharacterized protein PHACADRAFT_196226 [Phanerochaete carnosa HHB-10118-sp]EKM56172.1 hypothetical protein PHACADRAFT_196226 [Phanerochaete carnosa HHB-10118-sp]
MSALDTLVQIIANGVKDIQSKSAERGTSWPTPDTPLSPENEKLQSDFAASTAPVIAAACQLIATLKHPHTYLMDLTLSSNLSSSVCVAEAAYVPNILREAGTKGLHVNEIAAIRNVDAGKLGRNLRHLASRHIFEEVAPDIFRNNRISSSMCTGKLVQEMLDSPIDRWDGTDGFAALLSLNGDFNQWGNGWLADHLLDSATGHSQEPNEAAWQRAKGTKLTIFDWLELPEHALELRKVSIGMRATTSSDSDTVATRGFEWASLLSGSLVVDIGGGVGSLTMILAKVHKHLRYVVQDRHAVAKEGERLWKATMPGFVENGIVQLQGHDFFAEQPIKDAGVFIIRHVIHDWSDKYASKILSRLRDAAQPTTKLVVMDIIVDYMCRDSGGVADIPGATRSQAPEPLLPYADSATGRTYSLDICMMCAANCQERTLGHFVELLKSAGWKVERVCRFDYPLPQQLVCSPL